jgi:hypothetical protein
MSKHEPARRQPVRQVHHIATVPHVRVDIATGETADREPTPEEQGGAP